VSNCKGLHCEGCGDGGPGGALAAIAVVLVLASIIVAAVRAAWHDIVTAAEIAAYTVVSIAGVAALTGAGWCAIRIRRHVLQARARRISPQVRAVITDVKAGRPVVIPERPARPAIDAPPARPAWPLPGQWEQIRPRIGRDQ
jgi:hypothetical protein